MFRAAALLIAALCVTASPANATVVRALTLPDLTRFADAVVRGKVVDIYTAWTGPRLFTDVEIEVAECLKGDCAPTMTVRIHGGVGDEYVRHIAGQARFELGEQVLLFLEVTARGDEMRTTGMAQGKFRLENGVASRDHVGLAGRDAKAAKRLQKLPAADLLAALRTTP